MPRVIIRARAQATIFERGARHVYGGAERHGETGHVLVDAEGDGAFECHGYRGGRRLGAKGREIGREHRGDGPERVFARETGRDAVLEHEDADVEHENHGYYLYEREQDGAYLAA